MDNFLWKFEWDCGRMGNLESLFVATEEEVQSMIGKKAYFGEVLGKHSEIEGTIEEGEIVKQDLDSDTVEKVSKILGYTWSGYNPTQYVRHYCEKCGSHYCGYDWNAVKNICAYCTDEDQ